MIDPEFYNTQLGEPWKPSDPPSLKVARDEAEKARAAATSRASRLFACEQRPDGFQNQLESEATRLEELVKKMENAERIKRESGTKLNEHKYTSLRLTYTEGERSQRFADLIRDYHYAPQLEAARLAKQILDEAYPPNYHPGERDFLFRTLRSNTTFKDLVNDYFSPVYLSDLWFEYTT